MNDHILINDNESLYYGQYVLYRGKAVLPRGWVLYELGDLNVATHPSLPVTAVVVRDRGIVGYILGYFLNKEYEYLPPSVEFSHIDQTSEEWFRNNIYELGGRYVVLLNIHGHQRAYLDPSGSMPIVFNVNDGKVASSAGLLSQSLDNNLLNSLDMPESGLHIPFSLTAYSDVKRLIPNHYLDLITLKQVRHWPVAPFQPVSSNQGAKVVADNLVKTVIGIIKKKNICVPLTAGRDSRMLLAACHNNLLATEFITVRGRVEDVDSHVVSILKRNFGLNHRFIYRKPTIQSSLADWLQTVGHCVSGMAWKDHCSYDQFDKSAVLLPSLCGEIGRGFYYGKYDDPDTRLTSKQVLFRMKIPTHKDILAAAESYLEDLNYLSLDHFQRLDLIYNEQRLGSWAGPTELGGDRFTSGKLWPMCRQNVIQALHSLDVEVKLSNQMQEEVISLLWPELNNVKFNSYTGIMSPYLNIRHKMSRVPAYVKEKIRAKLK